jgi:plastocyanin
VLWLRGNRPILLVAALAILAGGAYAAATHRVAQKGREFQLKTIAIERGDRVQFTNEDEFLHQIYVVSAAFKFDSAEQAPGQTIEVEFPLAGSFEVRCHIHPKMLLVVTVR